MKKQLMIIVIIVILSTVGLSGCNSTSSIPAEKIIGEWKYESIGLYLTKIFYKNGSVFLNFKGKVSDFDQDSWTTYSLEENTLRIGSDIWDFSFSDDYQKLIINGDVYERQ